MEYKHRKRRTTASAAAGPTASNSASDKHEVHYGQWTPTYYGSNLELSLDRQTTKTSLHNSTTTAAVAATANNGYYGALVSPTAAAAGIHSTTTDAATNNNNHNNNNSFGARRRRGRSKSAPKGRDEDGINYGQLNSPPSSQPSQLQPQLQQPQCHPKVNVALSRSKSAEKNRRAASAGRVRTRTSAAAVTSERGGGSNVSNGRKGWGGFLRRKKHTNARQPQTQQQQQQQQQQSIATNSENNAHDENNNVCDYCHQIVHEKRRWQMYQRLNYAYCSTNCTRRHQQVLDAVDEIDALAITAGTTAANNSNSNNNSSLNFVEKSGFSSPPITPSAALLIQQQNQQQQNNNNNKKKGNNAANIHHGNGKQFFPSNAAVAVASNSSSEGQLHNTSPNNGNGKKKKQWFEEENEDNDNNNSSSLEESATRSGGGSNNFGIASHSQDSNISSQSWSRQSQNCNSIHSKHHATTTTTTATTPAASASIRISYGGRRGIGISDEYHRDYNDELSRQLRLAARQDELEYEERQFGNNVHPPPERRGVPPISYSPGETSSSTPAGRRYTGLLKRMGVVNGIDENATTSCTSSTNNNNTIKSNSSGGLVGRNRRKYPMMKQNENSTQSTVESVSSSSQGGASISHSVVVGSSLNQSPGTFASPATNLGWGRNTIAREEEPRRRRQQQQQQGTRGTTTSTISPFPTTTKMTKSNDSVVSIHSSMASWGYLDVGGNDDNGGGKKTSSFENEKKFIDTSWAVGVQSNNRTNSEAKRAFERLSGWPYNEDDEIIIMPEEGQEVEDYNRMREEDTKTPRKGNLSVKHVVAEANDRHVAHNTNVNGNNNQGSSGWNADKDVADWLGRNDSQKKEKKDHSSEKKASKKYERQVSSLSTVSKSPPSSLHSISEEQSFGMTDHNGNHHNHNELHLQSSVRFLAQKRGLRSIGPPGPSSRPITRSEAVELARADRAVEDVVSLVSYYDDPSLESLATNDDTLTTATSGPRGSPTYSSKGTRRQPPSGVHPGLEQRTITTKTRSKTFTGRKQQQQQHHQSQQASRSDPPGNSIDELLKAGIRSPPRPHEHRVNNRHHYRRDPSFHDAQHGLEPSFHGMEPEDYQEQLMQIHEEQRRQQQHDDIVPVETVYPKQRRSLQRQEQRISYPQQHPQQQQRHAHFLEHGADQSPDIQTPPRLRQQEWQWSENNTGPSIHQPLLDADDVRKEPSNEDENQFFFNNDQDEEEPEDDFFHVGNIEFPNPEKMFLEEEDSTSIGKLTDEGDDDDEPPLEEAKPDDDTVANTLDTVDLVAEVKRVWRHVQRYEKKKQTKKQLRRQYSNNYHSGGGDHADDGNMLNSVDEDMSVDENPMDALMQQFNELQTAANQQQQHQHHHDGDSKFSDITPSSHQVVTANTAAGVTSSRGRSSERPPMTPLTAGDGRLGKHIRSTSAHSRTHTPTVPASPGLDSNYAMTSHCSTEKDVVFLHEGVDEFYDEGRQPVQLMTNHQYQDSHDNYVPAPAATGVQQKSRRRQNQPSKSVLGKLQRSSPNTLQQYSKSHSNEEEDGEPMNNPHDSRREELLLSKPYDMTKTKSTGTSFTQKTQKISNITTNNNGPSPSVLRTEMARKYMKHRSSPPNSNAGLQRQQQQPSHYQTQQQMQQQQRSSTTNSSSVLHSKAMQNARDKRRMIINNNRVS